MRMVAGAILVLAAEQAFANSMLVRFPHDTFAHQVLLPGSGALLILGVGLLIWGLLTEARRPS